MVELFINILRFLFTLLTGLLIYIIINFNRLKERKFKITYKKSILLLIIFLSIIIISIFKETEIIVFIKTKIVEITVANNKQIIIEMDTLISQVIEDPKRVEILYKNKILQISGNVENFDVWETYIIFEDSNNNRIFFEFSDQEKISKLKYEVELKNLVVTIAGKYNSNIKLEISEFENRNSVFITDCIVIKN